MTRDIIYPGGFYEVVKYAYHQLTDLCYRKKSHYSVHFQFFAFFLHQFEGTNRLCEMIESF